MSFRPTPTTTRARRATARCTTYGQGRAGPFRGAPRPGPPDDAADRQNSVEATAPPRDTGGKRVAPVTPPVDALPVRPAAPQTPIAPAAPPVQTTAISAHATAGQRAATARRREPGQHDDAGFCAAAGRSDVDAADAIDRRRLAVAGPLAGGAGLGLVAVDVGGMNLSGGGGKLGGVGGAPLDIGRPAKKSFGCKCRSPKSRMFGCSIWLRWSLWRLRSWTRGDLRQLQR